MSGREKHCLTLIVYSLHHFLGACLKVENLYIPIYWREKEIYRSGDVQFRPGERLDVGSDGVILLQIADADMWIASSKGGGGKKEQTLS